MKHKFILFMVLFLQSLFCATNDQETPPLHFAGHESYIITHEKDSVILPCRTNSKDTRNTWYKDGSVVKDNISHTFRISPTNRGNAGVYRCVAINAHGGLRSAPTKLEIGYLDPPNPKTRTRSLVEVHLGQAVVLWPSSYARIFTPIGTHDELDTNLADDRVSVLDAVPSPRAKWTMNNGPIPATSSIYVSLVEQALILLNIDWSLDSAVFRAHLVNGYGGPRSGGGVYTQSFVLTVKEPAEWEKVADRGGSRIRTSGRWVKSAP